MRTDCTQRTFYQESVRIETLSNFLFSQEWLLFADNWWKAPSLAGDKTIFCLHPKCFSFSSTSLVTATLVLSVSVTRSACAKYKWVKLLSADTDHSVAGSTYLHKICWNHRIRLHNCINKVHICVTKIYIRYIEKCRDLIVEVPPTYELRPEVIGSNTSWDLTFLCICFCCSRRLV